MRRYCKNCKQQIETDFFMRCPICKDTNFDYTINQKMEYNNNKLKKEINNKISKIKNIKNIHKELEKDISMKIINKIKSNKGLMFAKKVLFEELYNPKSLKHIKTSIVNIKNNTIVIKTQYSVLDKYNNKRLISVNLSINNYGNYLISKRFLRKNIYTIGDTVRIGVSIKFENTYKYGVWKNVKGVFKDSKNSVVHRILSIDVFEITSNIKPISDMGDMVIPIAKFKKCNYRYNDILSIIYSERMLRLKYLGL